MGSFLNFSRHQILRQCLPRLAGITVLTTRFLWSALSPSVTFKRRSDTRRLSPGRTANDLARARGVLCTSGEVITIATRGMLLGERQGTSLSEPEVRNEPTCEEETVDCCNKTRYGDDESQ